MAYYVEPEYWVEGYAVGDAKLIAAEAAEASATKVAMGFDAYTSGVAAETSATKTGPTRKLASAGFLSDNDDQTSTIASPSVLLATTGASVLETTQLYAGPSLTLISGIKIDAISTMTAASRLKWESQTEPSDIWTSRPEPSDIWTDIIEPSDSWS